VTLGAAATFWCSTFAQVFALGFQSRNVNADRYVSAALTSWAIGAMQLVVVRGMVEAPAWQVLALTGTAGPLGIVLAMLVASRAFDRRM
jgi:hypothetical protein